MNNRFSRLRASVLELERMVLCLDQVKEFRAPAGEFSVAIVDDPTIAEIHRSFMEDPTPTDVITFPGNDDPVEPLAGEVIVSADHALSAAEAHGQDPAHELALYIVHGWLHLCGFDDLSKQTRVCMRAAEKRALNHLRKKNAFPRFYFEEV